MEELGWVDERKTELLRTFGSRTGQGVLAEDRVVFAEGGLFTYTPIGLLQKSSASGAKRARRGGKRVIEIPLVEITAIRRRRAYLQANALEIVTAGERYKFADVWEAWSEPIRRLLVERHGRTAVELDDGYDFV